MKFWLMKTFKDWAEIFLNEEQPFLAIDEPNIDGDYGKLNPKQKEKLFEKAAQLSSSHRRWATIQRYFDEFYDEVQIGDVFMLGIGQTTKFNVAAILQVTSDAYYVSSSSSKDARHRRDVKIIWQGEQSSDWGWANRIAKMDTQDRLAEFLEMYINLTVK